MSDKKDLNIQAKGGEIISVGDVQTKSPLGALNGLFTDDIVQNILPKITDDHKQIKKPNFKTRQGRLRSTTVMTKQGFPIVTKVDPVNLGLPKTEIGFNDLSVPQRGEKILNAVHKLCSAGYEIILYKLLTQLEVGAGFDDLDKIKVGEPHYDMLASDSQKLFLKYHILKTFENDYDPVYIEVSQNEAIKKQNNKEQLIVKKIEELNLKNENIKIEIIDLDEIKQKGLTIDKYKEKLKNKFLKEKLEEFTKKLETLGMCENVFVTLKANHIGLSKLISEFANHNIYVPNRGELKKLRTFIDNNLRYNDQLYFKRLFVNFGMGSRMINFLFNTVHESKSSLKSLDLGINNTIVMNETLLSVKGELESRLGFSLFLTDFDISDTRSLIKYNKLKSLYENDFTEIILYYADKLNGIKPIYTGLLEFDLDELDSLTNLSTGSVSNIVTIGDNRGEIVNQSFIQYELPLDFSDEEFLMIGHMFKGFFKNIEVKNGEYKPYFRGYVKGIDSEANLEFKGFFENGEGFAQNNILMIRDPETDKRILSLGIRDFDIDKFIHIGVQISYFLNARQVQSTNKSKKNKEKRIFLDKKQLFADMYYYYNQVYLKNEELFPLETFPDQYETLLQNIIYPLSREGLKNAKRKIKPQNTLAFGIHGTGKTQFANHLLLDRVFKFENQEFHLNANVIPLEPVMFAKVLSDGFSTVRQRLLEIIDNTGLPVLLVIEDIDSLLDVSVKDNGGELKTSMLDQMLTTFFEGVGSVPNIFVFTTSNHPEIVSLRLLRQNRLSTIIHFQALKDQEQMIEIFNCHIQKNGLETVFDQKLIEQYLPKFKGCSASHIAGFMAEIAAKIEYKKQINQKYKITINEIGKIFDNLHVNIAELEKMEIKMNLWLQKVRNKKQPGDNLAKHIL